MKFSWIFYKEQIKLRLKTREMVAGFYEKN